MNKLLHIIKRLSRSVLVLTVLFLVVFEIVLNTLNPLAMFFQNAKTVLRQMAMVAKLPEFLSSANDPPQVLMLGSSMLLFPALRCDEEFHDIKPRYDRSYLEVNVLGYSKAVYLEHLLSTAAEKPVTVLNLGMAAGMASDSYMIFRKAVEFGKLPQLLVVAVTPRDFLDLYCRQVEKTATFQVLADCTALSEFLAGGPGFADTVDFLARIGWGFYRARNDYHDCVMHQLSVLTNRPVDLYGATQRASYAVSKEGSVPDRHIDAGSEKPHPEYCPPKIDVSQALDAYRREYLPIDESLFERQMGYLRKLLSLARSVNVPVVLVDLPLSSTFSSVLPQDIREKYRLDISVLASQYGARLLEVTGYTSYDDKDFEDPLHMNAQGGRKLFAVLAKVIEKDGVMRMKLFPGFSNLKNLADNAEVSL